ncbi:MAG: single-stranded DNA-binding protein [Ruminococcus sp.]|nr:single-stranded DNA-binding protein [Ruminococcus sp.]
MNKVFFMGRLVADPEFSMSQSGMAYCRFRIAVDRSYNKPGEEKKSDFFRITCFGKLAEHVSHYYTKGKPILVEGKIQNDNYTDNNGVQQYRDTIIADSVSFVLSDPTRNGNNGGNYNNGGYSNGGYNNNNGYNNGGYNNNGYQNNNYNNGGYNNGGYNNGGYQNQPNYNNAPPQQFAPPVQQSQPKDVQLGNDSGKSDDFNDFEEIISDGSLPF